MVIKYPNQSQEILERQIRKVQMSNTTHTRMRESRKKVLESLAADAAINNLDAVLKTEEIKN